MKAASNTRRIDPLHPEPEILKEASQILTDMGIVMAPTETKYGLLARIDYPDAVKKVYDIKSRPLSVPTAIFIRSHDEIQKFGDINDTAQKISKKFLPGPITIVLKARADYPAPIVINNKIGLRFSSSEIINRLLDLTDFNLIATSANISGDDDPKNIEEAKNIFGDNINLYLDAGPVSGPASTVIYCSGETYKILREGAISEKDIKRTLEIN